MKRVNPTRVQNPGGDAKLSGHTTTGVASLEVGGRVEIAKCKVERTVFERIKVIGPMDESMVVLDMLHDEGWRTTRTGPYTDRKMWPSVDDKRFLFWAEREIRENE